MHGKSFLPEKSLSENSSRKLGALSLLMAHKITRLDPKDWVCIQFRQLQFDVTQQRALGFWHFEMLLKFIWFVSV